MSEDEIHEDAWPSWLPKPYAGNDKHQQLKSFAETVCLVVLDEFEHSDISSAHILETQKKVVSKFTTIKSQLADTTSKLADTTSNLVETQSGLEKAIGDNLKLGMEIDALNAAHKSEIDSLNKAHGLTIEANEIAFAKAALNTWKYDTSSSAPPLQPGEGKKMSTPANPFFI